MSTVSERCRLDNNALRVQVERGLVVRGKEQQLHTLLGNRFTNQSRVADAQDGQRLHLQGCPIKHMPRNNDASFSTTCHEFVVVKDVNNIIQASSYGRNVKRFGFFGLWNRHQSVNSQPWEMQLNCQTS